MPRSIQLNRAIGNKLLASLTDDCREALLPNLQEITFSSGQIIYESERHLEYIYFPTSCVISLLYVSKDGSNVEMGLVGNDGAVGIALFLGGETTPSRAVVQVAGGGLRMEAKKLHEEFARGGALQNVLLRYTQSLITQVSQTAVCNRLHSVEKRLCRWLLLCHDRIHSDELQVTQELISNVLGTRRESITLAATRLQDSGFIHYSRGHIKIIDREGLESTACECYQRRVSTSLRPVGMEFSEQFPVSGAVC